MQRVDLLDVVQIGLPPLFVSAQQIDRVVAGDPVQPGRERPPSAAGKSGRWSPERS